VLRLIFNSRAIRLAPQPAARKPRILATADTPNARHGHAEHHDLDRFDPERGVRPGRDLEPPGEAFLLDVIQNAGVRPLRDRGRRKANFEF
jgi:hypothetical protein